MFPPAALDVINRLLTALMALMDANSVAAHRNTHTLTPIAALNLHLRLNHLLTYLIRIARFGIPAPTKARPRTEADPAPAPSRPRSASLRAHALPRRPGWLLDALPDTAPAIAADLRTLLADPAVDTLLRADPNLPRLLNPLLRSLGLEPALSPPTDAPSPPPPQWPRRTAPKIPGRPQRARVAATSKSAA